MAIATKNLFRHNTQRGGIDSPSYICIKRNAVSKQVKIITYYPSFNSFKETTACFDTFYRKESDYEGK